MDGDAYIDFFACASSLFMSSTQFLLIKQPKKIGITTNQEREKNYIQQLTIRIKDMKNANNKSRHILHK